MAVNAVVEPVSTIAARVGASASVGASSSGIAYLKGDKGDPGPQGPAGQNGADGEDGFSPVITSTGITGGHRLSITDAEGTTTVDVMDGVGVPSGGTTGQVLKKASNTNYDTEWGSVEALPTGGTTGQVLAKASNTSYDVEWVDQSGGTVESVNNVTPDQYGNITLTADDIGTDEVGVSVQDMVDNYVHVGTSAPTDSSVKLWLDTDEPGMSAVSSVNGHSGTVVLDLDDIGFATLLWANASPNSTFIAQTVSIDLSDYDAVLIRATTSSNNISDEYYGFVNSLVFVGDSIKTVMSFCSGNTNRSGHRMVQATSSGVTFSKCMWNATQTDGFGVPYYIYGIKGVTT